MKIRQGFVSNSSSSSFIVAFKGRKPKSYEALRKLMFPELKDEDHLTVYDNTFP